jgi:hypothetical protein
MRERKVMSSKFMSGGLIVLLLSISQCATKTPSKANVPNELLGISIGMNKEAAKKHLEEIAQFERDEGKRQQVWRLKNDPHFSELAIGYDEENQVRYITTFVDPSSARERIRFTEIGDLSKAKQEILAPHYRYIWEVPASDGKPAYFVNVYGDNPDFLLHYSLSGKAGASEEEDEE